MTASAKRAAGVPAVIALALAGAGCASSVSTSAFKGEKRDVAETIANLQSDVSSGDEQKVCSRELSSALVARLNTARGGCKQAIKRQQKEIDSFSASVQSVRIGGTAKAPTASARVKSTFSGKSVYKNVSLIKEAGKWKIAGIG
jgi:hypothetical protein